MTWTLRVLRLLDESSSEPRGLLPCIAIGSTVVWTGIQRDHACETCEAWAWTEGIATAALLGFAGRDTSDPTVRVLAPAPGLAGLNFYRQDDGAAPALRGWSHSDLPGCDIEGATLDQLLASTRATLDHSGGRCRRGRVPNCVAARLVAEIDRLRGGEDGGGREDDEARSPGA